MFNEDKFSVARSVKVLDNSSLICSKDQMRIIFNNTVERAKKGEYIVLCDSDSETCDFEENNIRIIGYLDNYRFEPYLQLVFADFYIDKRIAHANHIVDFYKKSVEVASK